MRAVEALAISADRIDRLNQRSDPCMVQITSYGDGDVLDLFGLDNLGQLWQYKFNDLGDSSPPGWLPMLGGITAWPPKPPEPLKVVT